MRVLLPIRTLFNLNREFIRATATQPPASKFFDFCCWMLVHIQWIARRMDK